MKTAPSLPSVGRPSLSRKDTIIIAVLVNSMLLALLFALAHREERKDHPPAVHQREERLVQEVQKEPIDELDKIIQEYVLKAEEQQVVAPTDEYYTLKSGDNPWKIARKFHISFEKLLELNKLDEASAKNLKPGDKIRICEN